MDLISFRNAKRIVLDLETHDPDLKELGAGVRRDGYIVGIGIKVDEWKKYIPIAHRMDGGYHPMNEDSDKVFQWLREESFEYRGEIVGANLFYDLEYLSAKGSTFRNAKITDIQTAEPLLYDNLFSYSLDSVAERRLGAGKVTTHMQEKYGPDYIKMIRDCSITDTEKYVFGDLELPEQIWEQQEKELRNANLWEVFCLEQRQFHMLLHMKQKGVRVDLKRAEEVGKIFQERMLEHYNIILDLTNWSGDFNINSTLHKVKALDMFDVPYPYRKPTALMIKKALEKGIAREDIRGNPLLEKKVLESIPGDYPIVEHLVACKEYEHAYGTFIRNYIFGCGASGRIHCQFNQLKGDGEGTVSGRFSSSKPNLQNIPSPNEPDDRGSLIRSIFIPEEGCLWWSRDWSQIEYRLLVHYAEVTKCKGGYEAAELYRNDPKTDFHKMVQAMTNLPRKSTKTINFGICYGMGTDKLARSLKITKEEAMDFLSVYHEKVPFVKELFKKASDTADRKGDLYTLLGRRRTWDTWGKRFMSAEEREYFKPMSYAEAVKRFGKNNISRAFTHKGLNALLQGSAADLMKIAMAQIWESGLAEITNINLTVHDELNGSIPDTREAREALAEVTNIMQTCHKLKVPLVAEGSEAANWYLAK